MIDFTMEAMEDGDLIDAVLAEVNAARVQMGMKKLCELQPGVPGHTEECPIAMSLGDDHRFSVGGHTVRFASKKNAEACAKAWGRTVRASTAFDIADVNVRVRFPFVVKSPTVCAAFVDRFDNRYADHEDLDLDDPFRDPFRDPFLSFVAE